MVNYALKVSLPSMIWHCMIWHPYSTKDNEKDAGMSRMQSYGEALSESQYLDFATRHESTRDIDIDRVSVATSRQEAHARCCSCMFDIDMQDLEAVT
jgi:hypothetical protein